MSNKPSVPALWPSQPPTQLVPGLFSGELTAHLQLVTRLRMKGALTPLICLQGVAGTFFFYILYLSDLFYVNFSSTPRSPKWCFVTFRPNWFFARHPVALDQKRNGDTDIQKPLRLGVLMALVFRYCIQQSAVTGRFVCRVTLLAAALLLHVQLQ